MATYISSGSGSSDSPTVGEAPTQDGAVQLKAAALDAYRVSLLDSRLYTKYACLLSLGVQRPVPTDRVSAARVPPIFWPHSNLWT
jgi:hypothetical protein